MGKRDIILSSYYFGRFMTLEEARHKKLEKLGV